MIDALAFAAWSLIAFFLGIVPGAWLVETDRTLAGVSVGIAGFLLGGIAAELIVRHFDR